MQRGKASTQDVGDVLKFTMHAGTTKVAASTLVLSMALLFQLMQVAITTRIPQVPQRIDGNFQVHLLFLENLENFVTDRYRNRNCRKR